MGRGAYSAGPWNMVGPFDFDGDGFGDFVVSSSYAGEFCNGVYHYEAAGNDSLELKWVYTFYTSVALTMHIPVSQWGILMETETEILSLVDTSLGVSGQGLQVFGWAQTLYRFCLSQHTLGTWD